MTVLALALTLGSSVYATNNVATDLSKEEATAQAIAAVILEQGSITEVQAEQIAMRFSGKNREAKAFAAGVASTLVAAGLVYVGYEYGYKAYIAKSDKNLENPEENAEDNDQEDEVN